MKFFKLITMVLVGTWLITSAAFADITISPDMMPEESIRAIETAGTGSTVFIEPGTYQFRLYLDTPGVTVKGTDPNNRPVFDYAGKTIFDWPGTKTDWMANYAIIIQADDVVLEDIIIRNAQGSLARGLFVGPLGTVKEPAAPGTMPENVVIRNVSVSRCTEGIAATAVNLLFENCQIFDNGIEGQIAAKHNMYLQGGSITIKDSVFGKALSGQQINIRAQKVLIDNCDFDTFGAFWGMMNTPKATMINGIDHFQEVDIVNSRIQMRRHDRQAAKGIDVGNWQGYAGLTQKLTLRNNSFTCHSETLGALIVLRRFSGTEKMILESSGNSYAGAIRNYLYIPDGNFNDEMYEITVDDYMDSSLPGGSGSDPIAPPPPSPTPIPPPLPPLPPAPISEYDLNRDGRVDFEDVGVLLNYIFGIGSDVPEPTPDPTPVPDDPIPQPVDPKLLGHITTQWRTENIVSEISENLKRGMGYIWGADGLNRNRATSLDIAGNDIQDVEIYYQFSLEKNDTARTTQSGCVLRGSGNPDTNSNDSVTGYVLIFKSNYQEIELVRYNNGIPTVLAVYDSYPELVVGGDVRNVVARAWGDTIKVKAWDEGSPEPDGWDIEYKDADAILSGWTGYALLSQSHHHIGIYKAGVGVDGNLAPREETYGDAFFINYAK